MAADFALATRLKVRFQTSQGHLSVEDLWDLPLTSRRGTNLNDIAKGLFRQLKEMEEPDFVDGVKAEDSITALKFDIVKEIIEVRKAERAKKESEAARQEEIARLQELIREKEDEELKGKTVEELRALLEDRKKQ